MTAFSDEDLSAYLDNEAVPELQRAIEESLQNDPELAMRFLRLQANDAVLRQAFDAMQVASSSRTLAMLTRRSDRAPRRLGLSALRWAAPLAASLLLGLAIGRFTAPAPAAPLLVGAGGVRVADGLERALSTARSGVRATTQSGELLVSLSFRSKDGRFCRQFELEAETAAAGIACRTRGAWRLETWASVRSSNLDGFTTAGGSDNPVIAAALSRLGVSQALDRAGESAAIVDGWSSAPPNLPAPASAPAR